MRAHSPVSSLLALFAVLALVSCAPGMPGRITDRGIGGTGIDSADRGIGGTGIVGTVTAFGSIWVNGHEIDLPATTTVRVEGEPATPAAVQLGNLVAVRIAPARGEPPGRTGLEQIAAEVEIRYLVAGPISGLGDGRLSILGQRIEMDRAVLGTDLRSGAWVAVSGLRRTDGSIVAGRIDRWDPARGWLLRGTALPGVPGVVSLPGFTAKLALGQTMPQAGQSVRMTGSFGPEGPVATGVSADVPNPFGGNVGTLSLEIFVDAAGLPVGDSIELSQPAAPNGRVVVEGTLDGVGRLRATSVSAAPGIGRTGRPNNVGQPAARPAAGPAPAKPAQAAPAPAAASPAAASPAAPANSPGMAGPRGGPGGGRGGPGGGTGGGRGR